MISQWLRQSRCLPNGLMRGYSVSMPNAQTPVQTNAKSTSLAWWLLGGIGVFTVAASLALLAVFQQLALQQEEETFAALAASNAGFLKTSNLPRSKEMEQRLGAVIGAEVRFGSAKEVQSNHVMRQGEQMVITQLLDAQSAVTFSQKTAGRWAFLNRRRTWMALGTLWLASLGLGAWFAGGLVRPLKQLTEVLPGMADDKPLPKLPQERTDEVGELARALKEAHQRLLEERDRRRAAERLAILGRMAASLAHEVRNPVSAIRLHAQLLEGAPPAEAEDSRALIAVEAERIESLVRQWMHFARPEPPALVTEDLQTLIDTAVKRVSAQAAHAGVSIEWSGCVEKVSVDRERLVQALANLLLNAIQAQPNGGKVTVSTQRSGQEVEIIIDDEGTGFSEQALGRAGEPFFSEKEGGMGLGLASAFEVARAHGGVLLVQNRQPHGARVVIRLMSNL